MADHGLQRPLANMETFEYIILTVANHNNADRNEIESHCSNYTSSARYNTGNTKCVLKFPKREELPSCITSLTRYSESEILDVMTQTEWTTPSASISSASGAYWLSASLAAEQDD